MSYHRSAPPPDDDATVVTLPGRPEESDTPHPTPSPELFAGRYRLEALVGRGGMGRVYRARDVLVGDVVALKTLDLEKDPGANALERFRREVRLARRISHPHVARMHDLGEHEGQHFLTMEYVEGVDLRSLITHEGPLAPGRAAHIALAVCEGLAAAHSAGVVHRDLKSANVLVEKGGRVVLTDFGIARALAEEAARSTLGTAGTPMYMAPEQLSSGEVDTRADLYAVGLMLYEMLTAALPFSGDSPMAVAFARLHQPPPDPRAKTAVPDALAELVLHCLARYPEHRPASAAHFARSLHTWLESVGELAPTLVSLPALPTPPPPREVFTISQRLTTGEAGVAILPLRFQGPQERAFLGDALTDALIDVLSRTRGLRVPCSAATTRFRNEREPRAVGRELGVGFLVDGTVQSVGPTVRVSIRLVETAHGTQLWSDRFEDSSADAFEQQDRLGPRIAEALRVELWVASERDIAPPEALTLFRQGFVQGYTPGFAPDVAIGWLERSIELAPDFMPAQALHALLSMRAWFVGGSSTQRDWGEVARASAERLEQRAPQLPETHLARGMLAAQEGDWREAVLRARTSLEAAHTFPVAMLFLGSLQCEAGRADEGLVLLRRAFDLDSRMGLCLFEIARCSALHGRMEDYLQASERLAAFTSYRIPSLMLRLRVAAWMGDLEGVRRCKHALEDESPGAALTGLRYAAAVLGEVDPLASLAPLDAMLGRPLSPRFASLMRQLATEQLCLTGHPQKALDYFLGAAHSALIDLEWTDHCPALEPLRTLPGFAEGRREVRSRVEVIWDG
ncbi:protein kinase [Vitiosangium sp. GDMCC 1.1324]|uniref:protein kinase domain-containing protein n=1 Tax=Vitiosangium sp. (strain GDMCC 1.1324) TaxID=2138576 RepID=UPI000D35D33A|nr:serine/threonine-protein kinase [Vitiosangium sp. GDMCC 1.1324]PTL83761.1 serine/threonine protein kinase [Vitiosangium sp. GDMCC 1.1324]